MKVKGELVNTGMLVDALKSSLAFWKINESVDKAGFLHFARYIIFKASNIMVRQVQLTKRLLRRSRNEFKEF